MIKQLMTTETERIFAAALLETDRRYFEMAAEIKQLSCGSLAWMRGLTSLAASCVIHRVKFDALPTSAESWLVEIEKEIDLRNVPLIRIYLDDCPPHLHRLLASRGYQQRSEFGFLAPPGWQEIPDKIQLREVISEADWNAKLRLHQEAMHGPDGYTNRADLWVDMERRKCATGQMRSFLVERDGVVGGTVGAIVNDGLLRLKNIVVSPSCRQTGLGFATVQLMRRMADQDHNSRLGVFGVKGGNGSRLYRRSGLHEVTCQFEWSRLIH